MCKEKTKEFTCYDCEHNVSEQIDLVCWSWCCQTERDFTFGGEDTTPCEFFKEDKIETKSEPD